MYIYNLCHVSDKIWHYLHYKYLEAKSLETVEEAAAGRQGRNFLWDQSSPLKAALIVKEVLEISLISTSY